MTRHFAVGLRFTLLVGLLTAPSLFAESHGPKTAQPHHKRAIEPLKSPPPVKLPSTFKINEKVLSLFGTQFTIKDGKQTLGTIDQKIFSLTTAFTFTDAAGNKQSVGRAKFWSLGSAVEVRDANGNLIGTIKEKILESLFKVTTEYSILDADGNEIATSAKLDLFSTRFTLYDDRDREIAEIKRPMINFLSDSWNVEVSNPNVVDPRLLVLIPAFKTAADKYRSSNK